MPVHTVVPILAVLVKSLPLIAQYVAPGAAAEGKIASKGAAKGSGQVAATKVAKQAAPAAAKQTAPAKLTAEAAKTAEAAAKAAVEIVKLAIVEITQHSPSLQDRLADQVRDWIKSFGNQDNPAEVERRLKAYLEGLYRQMRSQIEQELQKQSKNGKKDRVINIIVIGHGAIRQPFIQSGFHYMSNHIRSVTFYQPWGCMLHSTGAYGIATNRISIDNRYFDPPIFGPPTHWNTIPNDATAVPLMYFSPVHHTDQAWQDLTRIAQHLRHDADGIVFEYLPVPGADQLPQYFPLPVLCTLFGIAASVFDATVNVRVAACLDWDDNNSHAQMMQYRSVAKQPTVVMGCNLGHVNFDVDMGGTLRHF